MANGWKLKNDPEYIELKSNPIPNPYHIGPPVDPNDRLSLIEWLCWNDRNGVYRDEDSKAEGWRKISLEQARHCYRMQTSELGPDDLARHLDRMSDPRFRPYF
jgi:hypothetical protein